MRNVMLWGDGPHLDLYYQVFCFLDEIAILSQNTPLTGMETDLVITEPFFLTQDRLRAIVKSGFHGIIIAEKPTARSPFALKQLLDALKDCNVYIAHTRLFAPPLPLPEDGEIIIDWPNRYDSNMHPLWNTLPNIADALFVSSGKMPVLKDAKLADTSLSFLFQIENRSVYVRIIADEGKQKVSVNGICQQWPNAFDTLGAVWHAAHETNFHASHMHALASINLIITAVELLTAERK